MHGVNTSGRVTSSPRPWLEFQASPWTPARSPRRAFGVRSKTSGTRTCVSVGVLSGRERPFRIGGGRVVVARRCFRFEAGFVAAFSSLAAVGLAFAENAETFSSNCTGVRLSVWLLLFVYYNLDTIISVSPSRRYLLLLLLLSRPCSATGPCLYCVRFSLSLSPSALFLVPLVKHDTEHRTKREREREGEHDVVIRYAFVRARERESERPVKGKRNVDIGGFGENALAAERQRWNSRK